MRVTWKGVQASGDDVAGLVESIVGRSLSEIAVEALVKAALAGLPITPVKTGSRTVSVLYEGRRAYFRVTAARNLSGGYIVCLRVYTVDCGRVAYVSEKGEVSLDIGAIPGYLSSPGELYNGFVADVWTARLRSVLGNLLEEIPRERVPAGIREGVARLLGDSFPLVKPYVSRLTGDYAFGRSSVYPVWVDPEGLAFSVSRIALEKIVKQ